MGRDEIWTESIAVGSEDFVRSTRQRIGIKVKGRQVAETGGAFTLREPMVAVVRLGKTEKNEQRFDNSSILIYREFIRITIWPRHS